MSTNTHLAIAPDVADALAAGRPVVALESTIIAHGMPYPRNLETARAVEAIIRDEGAVPATIAVLDGRIHIGLDAASLERLATSPEVEKLSRRDMAVALAQGVDGATTVAATMLCAHMAGIRVFVTGGIGGAHRGADTSFDISADLEELAHTPVAVICAGAKAILDLPKTLEYLETRGVPVIGYGTDELPAFYCRSSELPLDHRCDSPEQAAAIIRAQISLPTAGGLVIANPIPEPDGLDRAEMEAVIDRAIAEAENLGIDGKEITPFLLARLAELTGGRSLDANIALVKNNARIGARIAVALAG
jgi:pseudouridine-5'-phosphate glycosidase